MSITNNKPCIVIPCYQHGEQIGKVLEALQAYDVPVIVIDDGSSEKTVQCLQKYAVRYPDMHIDYLPKNCGKGAAFTAGLEKAATLGCTHVVQLDADGQHDVQKLPLLLAISQQYPEDLISACPEYDQSIPKIRLISRYITHVCVWCETLSLSIKDSMCGFRVYPLKTTLSLIKRVHLGTRMDFDTEIMVRLYWQGLDIRFVPVKVIYPENGWSNFRMFKDNVRISWMHTKLFCGMLMRLPNLLFRKCK